MFLVCWINFWSLLVMVASRFSSACVTKQYFCRFEIKRWDPWQGSERSFWNFNESFWHFCALIKFSFWSLWRGCAVRAIPLSVKRNVIVKSSYLSEDLCKVGFPSDSWKLKLNARKSGKTCHFSAVTLKRKYHIEETKDRKKFVRAEKEKEL